MALASPRSLCAQGRAAPAPSIWIRSEAVVLVAPYQTVPDRGEPWASDSDSLGSLDATSARSTRSTRQDVQAAMREVRRKPRKRLEPFGDLCAFF